MATKKQTGAASAPSAPAAAISGRKPWKKKTPVEVVRHALEVEGHRLRHRLLLHFCHDFLIDRVAVRFVLIDDEGEESRLRRFEFGHRLEVATSRHSGEVVSHALEVLQGSMLHPHLLAHLRHLLVLRNLALGHRYKKSIDVRHALASIVDFQRDKFTLLKTLETPID